MQSRGYNGKRYLTKGGSHLLQAKTVRYQFREEAAKEFPIEKMTKVLKVSVSGYYAYLHRNPSLREEENSRLLDWIRKIYQEGKKMYGSPRVHDKIKKLENACFRKRIARLMRKNGCQT